MTAAVGPTTTERADFSLAEAEFAMIAEIARTEAGIVLLPEKAPMVQSRLVKRLRALGLTSVPAYCARLTGPERASEVPELISVLTTNVTSFYRERHHFELLRTQILPDLMRRAEAGERVRFWSAGCSTGPEPITLAIEILDACPQAPQLDVRILATDIDRRILTTAKRGRFERTSMSGLSESAIQRHFHPVGSGQADTEVFEISADIRALIHFRELNLIKTWPMQGPFDVIFCRNVLIYFGPDTQRTLCARFQGISRPGGTLFLGHSERIEAASLQKIAQIGTTAYRFQ